MDQISVKQISELNEMVREAKDCVDNKQETAIFSWVTADCGTDIDCVRDHLAILYVLTLNPDRHTQYFDRLFAAGRQAAEKVLREDILHAGSSSYPAVIGWRKTYGHANTDRTGTIKEAFYRADIERIENRIIELVTQHR